MLGLPSTDNVGEYYEKLRDRAYVESTSLGIISILLFWQLIQIGVACIISNLLTLRPLVQSAALGRTMYSLRGLLSLQTLRKKLSSQSGLNLEQTGDARTSESSRRGLHGHGYPKAGFRPMDSGDLELGYMPRKDFNDSSAHV